MIPETKKSTFVIFIMTSLLTTAIDCREEDICSKLEGYPLDQIIVNWTIKNGKLSLEASAEDVWSPSFYGRDNSSEWKVVFQPVSDNDTNYVGIYVHRLKPQLSDMKVKLDVKMKAVSGGTTIIDSSIEKAPTTVYGISKFDKRRHIIDLFEYTNRDLLITCTITILSKINAVPCTA